MNSIDQIFKQIIDTANSFEVPTQIIEKAYLKAKDLHKDQKRKDGTPYIYHPVEVALILAKLGFDENVIAGGLLHDTMEDCGYTPEQLKSDFNETIFDLVDCVSAIDNTNYVFNKDNVFEDTNFVKSSAEEQTFIKLISLGKQNPCGFAIKFADRLHNLRTISSFEYPKQLEKVRETEKWVIPIAKALQSEYFYREIKNECFKIVNQFSLGYFEQYNNFYKTNTQIIVNLENSLNAIFKGTNIKKIVFRNVKEYKIFEDLVRLNKNVEISKVSQGQILKVTNYNIYMLYNSKSHKEAVFLVLEKLKNNTKLKIIDAKIGGFTNKMYFQLEDDNYIKYNMYIMSESEFVETQVGTLDGQHLESLDEDNINHLDDEIIKVRTRSNEIKYIAKNSTVLDFAFKIHKDIGFAFKYAIINDGKTKYPPYTKLNSNDKVEIVVDKINDKLKNNAELKWFAYVNTELAKKILIKYFENK